MAAEISTDRTIFLEAVEYIPKERWEAFIKERCADDVELYNRVERLLRAHSDLGEFQDHKPSAANAATVDAPPIEWLGTQIGPYKLLEQIGEGGFGVVFLAEQERPVRRKVALKIIKPGMDTRQVIARFEAERQALAMMDHPNIAKVHDAGATENGRPYFVMELVQGVPITEYCDQCNLTTRERLELFILVCQAVQHAHQKGIIHRDIKPTNVLVAMQDGQPSPKIIDFGVAKAVGQRLTEHTLTTAFAQMVGSPLYMSPEQAELSPMGVDTRSDIYSLGVMLYELLAGTTPFDKDRLHAASYDELRRIIREEEPPRPSARISTLAADLATTVAEHRRTDSRRLGQTVRGELDWIVMKCLEKDRNRRYETPNSLARDIERYLQNEPVQACPPSTSYRLRKFALRNKSLLAAGGAIAAALVVGLALSTWMYFRASTESARAKAVSDLLQEMLGSSNTERSKGSQYTVRELLDDYSATLGSQLSDQPDVQADIDATIGRAYRSLMLPNEALLHFEKAIELRRKIDGPQNEKLAAILVDYGWNLRDQGRFIEAEPPLREALEIYRHQGVSGGPVFHAMEILQHVLISSDREVDAARVTQEALAIASRSDEEFPDKANLLHRYATLKIRHGHFAEAEQLARQAVDMHRRLQGVHHPETGHALRELASALQAQQKLAEAESPLRESLAIFRRCYPEDHPYVRLVVGELKTVLKARGDQSALERLATEVDERARRSDGPDYHVRLAGLLLKNNSPIGAHSKEARRLIRRAIDEYGQTAADSRDNLDRRLKAVQGYADVATLCAAAPGFGNEFDEATRRLTAEFPELLATFPDRDATIDTLYTFALARLRLGDQAGYRDTCAKLFHVPDGAYNYIREYRRIWAWCLGPEALKDLSVARKQVEEVVAKYPQGADHRLALGAMLYRCGQYERAAEQLQKSISPYSSHWSGEAMVINSQLLLAMTKWQQGKKDEARCLFAEIRPAIDEAVESPTSPWIYRTTTEVLHREAEALIGKEPTDEAK